MLVEMVGGLVEAARIAKVDRDTINNWRKQGSRVPILGVLPLAIEAQVTLDWVATGYQQRDDIEALGWRQVGLGEGDGAGGPAPGFVQLLPLRPQVLRQAQSSVERWTPFDIAVSETWLTNLFDLTADSARYAIIDEAGMSPTLPKGAGVIVDRRADQPLRSGLYLTILGDELLPRRLYRLPNGVLELVADADPNWRFPVPTENPPPLHRIVWSAQSQ